MVQVEESESGQREEELKDGLREECLGVEEVLSRSTDVRDEELTELVGLPNVREGSEVDDLRRENNGRSVFRKMQKSSNER